MQNKKRKNYGFSLIELIAVMAIISIISAIAIPKISRYIDEANKTKVIAAVSELNNHLILEKIKSNNITLSSILSSYNLESLKINLQTNGNFKIGNLEGRITLEKEYINAHLTKPDYFSNIIIGPTEK